MLHPTPDALAAGIDADRITSFDHLSPVWQKRLVATLSEPDRAGDISKVSPQTLEELGHWVTYCHRQGWRILPAGSGSKLHWGSPIAGENLVLVSTEHLNAIVDHAAADLTVTVEAGTQLGNLQAHLQQQRQFWPVNPLYPDRATVGGLVATGDTGAWRHRYGGIRDLVLGLTCVRADGQIVKAGGRVVKNVAGYDLMKLFTGSYGTLGILAQVTLRLYPQPQQTEIWLIRGDLSALEGLRLELFHSPLTPAGADLLSAALAHHLQGECQDPGLMIRFHGLPDSVTAQASQLQHLCSAHDVRVSQVEQPEIELDRQISSVLEASAGPLAKIGMLPHTLSAVLEEFERQAPGSLIQIHASGVGRWRGAGGLDSLTWQTVRHLQCFLQDRSGYLMLLELPSPYREELSMLRESTPARQLQYRLKRRFDPENTLSPGRLP